MSYENCVLLRGYDLIFNQASEEKLKNIVKDLLSFYIKNTDKEAL
jgi:hypothetical protein